MTNRHTLFARQDGVTLIELMIVVVIMGIIVAIAYPSYLRQTQKASRTDATSALLAIAAAQEKEFLKNSAFTTDLGVLGITETDADKYKLSVVTPDPSSFVATAEAAEHTSQASDTKCKFFTIDHTGAKRAGEAADPPNNDNDCW